jgi:hypothetical protein
MAVSVSLMHRLLVVTVVVVVVLVVDQAVVTVTAATVDLLQPLMEPLLVVLVTAEVEVVKQALVLAEEDLTAALP